MHEPLQKYKPPNCGHGHSVQAVGDDIGRLFRDWGEEYIRVYNPDLRAIKLIRSIRVCGTPALGGKRYNCDTCGLESYVYFSCGNAQCPLCQGGKRKKWENRLRQRMLQVPYMHTIFTLPAELRGIAKMNQCAIYGLLMRSAWQTVLHLTKKPENVGGKPGMTTVLHTFGSDLKYHIHAHCLITFGGVNKAGEWVWPKRKRTIATYEDMCQTFREIFLKGLEKAYKAKEISYHLTFDQVKGLVGKKRWVVHSRHPTTDTEIIEEYLSRYICRVGISKNRLKYDAGHQMVTITHKDYTKQKEGKAAPIAYKQMPPLLAIGQILQHVLPKYFQKSRHYGLHHSRAYNAIKDKLPEKIKRNVFTIRLIFQIMNFLSGLHQYNLWLLNQGICPNCLQLAGAGYTKGSLTVEDIPGDSQWIQPFLSKNRGSPSVVPPPNTASSIIGNRTQVRQEEDCPKSNISDHNIEIPASNTPSIDEYITS